MFVVWSRDPNFESVDLSSLRTEYGASCLVEVRKKVTKDAYARGNHAYGMRDKSSKFSICDR